MPTARPESLFDADLAGLVGERPDADAADVGLELSAAASELLIPKYDVEALLKAIRDYHPTYFPAVPTIYISLLSHPKVREYGIDKVRAFNSGSAPLPVEVIAQFERLTGGVTLSEGYGLSEASPVTHSTAALACRKPGSIGLPLPDTDFASPGRR